MNSIASIFGKMSMRFGELSKAINGRGTIIVHPQLSRTPEEAKELAGNWGKREARQITENILNATRGK